MGRMPRTILRPMDRRQFLAASAFLAGVARAQPDGRMRRVGFLGVTREMRFTDAAVARLRELGFVEGRNLSIEYAYTPGHAQAMQPFADDLAKKRVEVIVAW